MSDSKTASSARLEETDLLRLRHFMGGLLMLVAVWGVALLDNASPLEAFAAMAAIAAGLCAPGWFASRGERFWTWTGWVVVALCAADIVFALVADRSKLVVTVIRVALMISVLRTLQPRSRREDMQLILLALFLCAIGGALSLSPVFAVQVFLFIPLAGGILFLLNRLEGAARVTPGKEGWSGFRWRTFFGRIRAALTPGTLAVFAGAILGVVVWGSFIFAVMPRGRMDRELPFLKLPGKGKTGFSDSVSLGGVSDIMRDEAVALRADTPGRVRPIANLYWRMIALDAYRGGEGTSGFTRSVSAERVYRENSRTGASWTQDRAFVAGAAKPVVAGDWKVFMEGNVANYLPVPGLARRIRFDKTQEWEENDRLRLLRLRETPSTGTAMLMSLAADSSSFPASPTELPALDAVTTPSDKDYPGTLLSLPADLASREKLRRTVAGFSAKPLPVTEFVAKASDWLAKHHAYALQDGYGRTSAPAGEPRDYIVRWMHAEATGWCEHYATSFVLLARTAGYPARLVTGFSGGDWNEGENYLVVRMKHAHAWVEIYDRESQRWLRVDPTPNAFGTGGEGVSTDRAIAGSFSGLNAWYDSMRMLWFRRVVNFDEAGRDEAAKNAVSSVTEWGRQASETIKAWKAQLLLSLREWAETPAKFLPVAAGVSLCIFVLMVVVKYFRRRVVRAVLRAGEADPRVRRFRERAGRALARIDRAVAAGSPVDSSVRAAVETVRFGAPSSWPDPVAALDAVGPALRRVKRKA